jgi:Fibronectin type III domain/HYR domain
VFLPVRVAVFVTGIVIALPTRDPMLAHTLRIACVVAVMTLGFARHLDAASLTLTWDHSPSSNTAGYLVSYGTQSGKYTTTVKAGYVKSVTITGLTEGTTYYFSVQSYDSAGTLGSRSPEISGKVAAAGPVLSISCPSPVLTSLDGNPIAVTLTPTVSGGVAPISTTCSPASGSQFAVGTTSFSCTAADAAQQKASCASKVVVAAPSQPAPTPSPTPTPAPAPAPAPEPELGPEPEPAPELEPPPTTRLTLQCPVIAPVAETRQSGKASVSFPDPIFSDGTLPVTVSCAPTSGSQFRIGTTTVSCSATNAARERFACTTTVTVTDRPTIVNKGGS